MRVRRTMCAATVAAGLAFGVGTDKRWSAGAERNRRSGRRGRRPVAGAHQDQHEQPAGQRSAGGRAVARASPRSGSRSRCSRHLRRARPTSSLGSVPRTRRRSRCCWRAMRTWSVSSASCGTSTPSAAWCAGATSSAAAPWTSRAAWRPGGLAAFTVAAMRLARSKATLNRDVILLAEADEEGGDYGTSWLAENRWPKIEAGISLKGGWVLEDRAGTPRLMGITTVDKNSLSVTLRTRGTSTHSSRPLPDSAIDRLTRALARIGRYETTPPELDPTARRYLRTWTSAFRGRSATDVRAYLRAKGPAARRRAARPSSAASTASSSTA